MNGFSSDRDRDILIRGLNVLGKPVEIGMPGGMPGGTVGPSAGAPALPSTPGGAGPVEGGLEAVVQQAGGGAAPHPGGGGGFPWGEALDTVSDLAKQVLGGWGQAASGVPLTYGTGPGEFTLYGDPNAPVLQYGQDGLSLYGDPNAPVLQYGGEGGYTLGTGGAEGAASGGFQINPTGLMTAAIGTAGGLASSAPQVQRRLENVWGPEVTQIKTIASQLAAPFTFGISAFAPAIEAMLFDLLNIGRGRYAEHRKVAARTMRGFLPLVVEALPYARSQADLDRLMQLASASGRQWDLGPEGIRGGYEVGEEIGRLFNPWWQQAVDSLQRLWADPTAAAAYYEGRPTMQEFLDQRIYDLLTGEPNAWNLQGLSPLYAVNSQYGLGGWYSQGPHALARRVLANPEVWRRYSAPLPDYMQSMP